LAYRKKQAVNWCPKDLTVLADEQVVSGKCERCGAQVIQRELEQWFFRITKYAEKLLNNLEGLDWSEKIKIAQKNWIGRSEGAAVDFEVKAGNIKESITVFTTRPDTLFGATYLVLAPEHSVVKEFLKEATNEKEIRAYIETVKNKSEEERVDEKKEKTGAELKGIHAVNPANGESIPVWISDYVLASYGTGAIMAVPAHDQRDFEFAKKFNLPIKVVISDGKFTEPLGAAFEAEGKLINSGEFSGQEVEKVKWEITKFVRGKKEVKFRLRDWLISRQRYWGPPIPMIFCETCAKASKGEKEDMPGWYSVPEKDLPVKLPVIKDFRPTGSNQSPLAASKFFYEVKCPSCKAAAKRETDVSDTFLDSAWYYLRYPSSKNKKEPWDKEITKKWLPLSMYTGGAEHAVLHLLYVRFMAMAIKDFGLIDFEEPATRFRAHGLLIKDGAKMSKSKGNVVNPDEYIKNFGADTLRMYLMFLAPFEQGGDFRDESVMGITRFLDRVWKFIQSPDAEDGKNLSLLHRTIKKVTGDIENLHYNTAISAMMILLNSLEGTADRKEKEIFLKLLAPFAPHLSEELWTVGGFGKTSIHIGGWPEYNPDFCEEDRVKIVVQVNGKVRVTLDMPSGVNEDEAVTTALSEGKIKEILQGKKPDRTIYVANRLINFVIKT
jgi:leucyl-tRNA synthetase